MDVNCRACLHLTVELQAGNLRPPSGACHLHKPVYWQPACLQKAKCNRGRSHQSAPSRCATMTSKGCATARTLQYSARAAWLTGACGSWVQRRTVPQALPPLQLLRPAASSCCGLCCCRCCDGAAASCRQAAASPLERNQGRAEGICCCCHRLRRDMRTGARWRVAAVAVPAALPKRLLAQAAVPRQYCALRSSERATQVSDCDAATPGTAPASSSQLLDTRSSATRPPAPLLGMRPPQNAPSDKPWLAAPAVSHKPQDWTARELEEVRHNMPSAAVALAPNVAPEHSSRGGRLLAAGCGHGPALRRQSAGRLGGQAKSLPRGQHQASVYSCCCLLGQLMHSQARPHHLLAEGQLHLRRAPQRCSQARRQAAALAAALRGVKGMKLYLCGEAVRAGLAVEDLAEQAGRGIHACLVRRRARLVAWRPSRPCRAGRPPVAAPWHGASSQEVLRVLNSLHNRRQEHARLGRGSTGTSLGTVLQRGGEWIR